jgi:hypothetical protein
LEFSGVFKTLLMELDLIIAKLSGELHESSSRFSMLTTNFNDLQHQLRVTERELYAAVDECRSLKFESDTAISERIVSDERFETLQKIVREKELSAAQFASTQADERTGLNNRIALLESVLLKNELTFANMDRTHQSLSLSLAVSEQDLAEATLKLTQDAKIPSESPSLSAGTHAQRLSNSDTVDWLVHRE